MIFIEIKNIKEIVRKERGWFSATVGPFLTDLEAKVEQEMIAELLANFEKRGVEASISNISGVQMHHIQRAAKKLVHRVVTDGQDDAFDDSTEGIE